MPLAVIGEFTSCVYPWLDIKLTNLELVWCKMSSLKSPRITYGKLDMIPDNDSTCIQIQDLILPWTEN